MISASIFFIALAVYVVAGAVLDNRAFRHRRDGNRRPWDDITPVRLEDFTPEGQLLRKRAMRFYAWGGLALVIGLAILVF